MVWTKRVLAPTLMLLLMGSLMVQLPLMAGERGDALSWFEPVMDVLRAVDRDYVEEIDEDTWTQLQAGAIKGMLDVLDDPYTEFISLDQLRDFDKDVRGTYVGIGAEVALQNGWLTIISPMAGSPALRAGIKAGDQIRKIDGVTTWGEPIDTSISRLLGEPGTSVQVSVYRPSAAERKELAAAATDNESSAENAAEEAADEETLLEIKIERQRIDVATVEGVHREGESWDYWVDPAAKIAYIRLTQFTSTTPMELDRVLRRLNEQGLEGLVLDLRFNPGGALQAAIGIADLFLEDGMIVEVRGRNEVDTRSSHAQDQRNDYPDVPMVLLVNGQSASASEIVAGALKYNDRAVVVGTRTFGKGKVQELQPLPSGKGQLKLTTAYYYVASGRPIQRMDDSDTWGVDPNEGFYVPMTDAEYVRMRQVQRELDIIRDDNGEGEWSNPEWISERLKDKQLAAAVEAIKIRVDQDEWVATGQEMDPDAEIFAELASNERREELLITELERVQKEISNLKSFVKAEDDGEGEVAARQPILPADAFVEGGTLEIRDPNGNVVAVLRIDDQYDLIAALERARVTRLGEDGDAAPATPANDDDSDAASGEDDPAGDDDR